MAIGRGLNDTTKGIKISRCEKDKVKREKEHSKPTNIGLIQTEEVATMSGRAYNPIGWKAS